METSEGSTPLGIYMERFLLRCLKRSYLKYGFSLLELISVVAVIGIATSIGAISWMNARDRLSRDAFANKVRSQIQSARFEAIKRNRNIAIFFDRNTESLRVIVKDSGNRGCDVDSGDLEIHSNTVNLPDIAELDKSIFIEGSFMNQGGIVWRPTGLTGRCSNFNAQGFHTLQIRFAESLENVTDFSIVISSAGRVDLR